MLALSKMLGGVSGNFIALAIMKPKTTMDALSRIMTSVILSYYLTTPIAEYFLDDPSFETEMAVAMGIGLFGWFIVSIALHTINSAKTIRDLKEKL